MFVETKREGETTIEPWRKVLLDAADYIEKHGWCQGRIGNAGESVCAVGAMWMAFDGTIPKQANWVKDRAVDQAYRAMCNYVMCNYVRSYPAEWNDEPGRTAAEVTAAMRECAAQ